MTKRTDLSANLTTAGVLRHAELERSRVRVSIECAGCGSIRQSIGYTKPEAIRQLRGSVDGWGVVFDREVNDGEYPYCPACLKRLFPNLQERLRRAMSL